MLTDDIFFMGRKITEGTVIPAGIATITLPLKYTEVRANIIGLLVDVKVIQKFQNTMDKNIEAIYVFPLPHESAVNDLEIKIDKRIIKAEVKEREEARKTYEEARDEGKKAGLLEQERPNIFTMSVANIEPGQEIYVTLTYHETLKYEDGEYEFVFPMTITPRYTGDGETVSDADKISPPVSETSQREVNIFVNLNTGFPLGEVKSPTHLLYMEEKGEHIRNIQLAKEGEIPNKDFILTYSSKGEHLENSLAFYRKEGKPGTFMLHMTPKIDYGPEEMLKREMIFVLDRSGSMSYGSGFVGPMEQAKAALKSCLRTLRTGDAFNIITFDTFIENLAPASMEFNDENLKKAEAFIDATYARGGTDIYRAMECALKMPVNKIYLRQIVFLTDGAVGNEEEILKELQKILGKARVFTFGIGPSVNRYLLDKMARMGKGTAHYLMLDEDIEEAIQKFSNQAAFPILCDISLEWKGGKVADLYPSIIPDLYFGQVLYIVGRFYSEGNVTAILKTRTAEGDFIQEFPAKLPEKDEEYPVIETIWARKRIDSLLDRQREYPQEKASIRDEIIGIAMKYKLMSPYTSLVAVEKTEGEEGEKEKKEIITINVPSILPEGLNHDVFSPPPIGSGFSGGVMFSSMACMPPLPAPQNAGDDTCSMAPVAPAPSLRTRTAAGMGGGLIKVDLLPTERKSLSLLSGVSNLVGDVIDGVKAMVTPKKHEVMEQVKMDGTDLEKEHFFKGGNQAPLNKIQKEEGISEKSKTAPPVILTEETDAILKWLIRNQTADGYFSNHDEAGKKIIATSLAVLAFIGQGHSDRTGKYKPQMGKAIINIVNNLDKLSSIPLSLSAWVLFELYHLSQKKKEKDSADRAIQKIKDSWGKFTGTSEKFFAAIGARTAMRAGLIKEGELPDIDDRISSALSGAKEISSIITLDDFLTSIISLISGKEEIYKSFLNFLGGCYTGTGPEKGSFHTSWERLLGSTGTAIFVISWKDSKLIGK
ncbi:MAG: VIT domain-containing protein [Candidatus Eremiobacterota bacterium]